LYNPIYLAILVPIIWAFADFLSKILINWCGSKQAVLLVQISATIFTIVLVLFIKPPFPDLSSTFLVSIITSSVLSALAWIFFFKGLEGRLSITEPIAYSGFAFLFFSQGEIDPQTDLGGCGRYRGFDFAFHLALDVRLRLQNPRTALVK
jgi:uncharacterized membrane protein